MDTDQTVLFGGFYSLSMAGINQDGEVRSANNVTVAPNSEASLSVFTTGCRVTVTKYYD